jgi:hypothetical protein
LSHALQVLELLQYQLANLPSCIRFVLTSRPEQHIVSNLSIFKPMEIMPEDGRHRQDIKLLLAHQLKAKLAADEDLNDAVSQLLDKSEGTFVYVSELIKHMKAEKPGGGWTREVRSVTMHMRVLHWLPNALWDVLLSTEPH